MQTGTETYRLMKQFWPASFEERGAVLHFMNQHLCRSRFRAVAGDFELVVAGFSGAEGEYVIPARQVTDLLSLNLHDQALLALLTSGHASNPISVRMAALKVAKSGLGGPEMQATAEDVLQQYRAEQMALFRRIVSRLDGSWHKTSEYRQADPPGSVTEAEIALVDKAISSLAGRLALKTAAVRSALQEIVTVFAPTAGEQGLAPGRFRQSIERVRQFADDIQPLSAAGSSVRTIHDIAARTIDIGAPILAGCDAAIANWPRLVRSWAADGGGYRGQVLRLAWLLDGWDEVCDIWETQAIAEGRSKSGVLSRIRQIIPLLPRSEVEAAQGGDAGRPLRHTRRVVRPHQDWRTGKIVQGAQMRPSPNDGQRSPARTTPDLGGEFVLPA